MLEMLEMLEMLMNGGQRGRSSSYLSIFAKDISPPAFWKRIPGSKSIVKER
jgi:hypothetical protein